MRAAGTPDKGLVSISKKLINELRFPTAYEGRRILWDRRLKGLGIRVNPTWTVVFVVRNRMKAKGAKLHGAGVRDYNDAPRSIDRAGCVKLRR